MKTIQVIFDKNLPISEYLLPSRVVRLDWVRQYRIITYAIVTKTNIAVIIMLSATHMPSASTRHPAQTAANTQPVILLVFSLSALFTINTSCRFGSLS